MYLDEGIARQVEHIFLAARYILFLGEHLRKLKVKQSGYVFSSTAHLQTRLVAWVSCSNGRIVLAVAVVGPRGSVSLTGVMYDVRGRWTDRDAHRHSPLVCDIDLAVIASLLTSSLPSLALSLTKCAQHTSPG